MKKAPFFLLLLLLGLPVSAKELTRPIPAPVFHTSAELWINSRPLTMESLRGRVLLLDVWTFGCWNCYRSFPWLNDLEERFKDQAFTVLGIHSPEFAHEKDKGRLLDKVQEFGLKHPVMMDNDLAYWRALGNRYWPAFYLVDKEGLVRYLHVGETHKGDRRARAIERDLLLLLAE